MDLEQWGYRIQEDRDNFDYLYNREDLAELSGKAYHKKRNLVNAFLGTCACEQRPLTKSNVADAVEVLDRVAGGQGAVEGDYAASREALERLRGPGNAGGGLLRGRQGDRLCPGRADLPGPHVRGPFREGRGGLQGDLPVHQPGLRPDPAKIFPGREPGAGPGGRGTPAGQDDLPALRLRQEVSGI
ncbi:MAG: phosphatidylglycerol lysyltransferase domain-containing protein [Ignavibacteriales bacterium]|nr:phosphatidylglycerol lysyltransferase domain-containing protein [Ignavibacteriales bacterium]